MTTQVTLTAVPNIPHVQPGDNVTGLILDALATADLTLQNGDILAIAQKIISKAEGRLANLADVVLSARAIEVAEKVDKDPRLVELILRESDEISRMKPGVLIVRHRLGFTSANAGIDRSNIGPPTDDESVLLLPVDPDASARRIRQAIHDYLGIDVGVVITDTHGRPFRLGNVGVAIGAAGLPALWNRRGESDLYGYELQHTDVGVADEIAAAAGLLMGQAGEGLPVVLLRGLKLPSIDGKASDLARPKELDLYR
ncbi:MAG: coenzyme F420-0:L-glutamate ligase [Chloroflexi bacterium]|nr:coenzyme F420-0:L-glutamate ligase [Chloroflexota bacterium]